MAPELIQKQVYQGQQVDLFALGIILFILYTGHPPFNSANPEKDPHYKLLADGKADLFWKQHSRNKPEGFFTEDFKDLISNMLQLDPVARLSLVDCVGHKWMQGPMATQKNVQAEFAQRAKTIAQKQISEVTKKAQSPKPTTATKGRRINVRRDVKLGDEENKDEQMDLPLLKSFNEGDIFVPDSVLYSTYDPEFLLETLQQKLMDLDLKFDLKQKKLKVGYDLQRDPIVDDSNQDSLKVGDYVRVQAKITEIDEDRVALEFKKMSGSAFFFREHVQLMKDLLGEFNDATPDSMTHVEQEEE